MIDLHTHTFFSDGVLIPSELFQRARAKGYHTIAVTDHCGTTSQKEGVEFRETIRVVHVNV